jgi:FAD:protein FMN transferase
MQQINFRAMGCHMMAAIDSNRSHAAQRLAAVPAWFEVWEQRLSRFRPDSELNQVNQHRGKAQPVSTVMSEVIHAALLAQQESDGLVNPLLLEALEAAGYDRSFDKLAQDGPRSTNTSQALPTRQGLHLDPRRRKLVLPPDSRLDLGGIAKGWAADRAAQRLGKLAPALVNAGGDIAVSGPQAEGKPWPVSVANPLDPEHPLDLVLLHRGGVATSGRDYRRWRRDGVWQHHILDPRTGRPALTDVLSVTVVAPSARMAEAAAKTVLILGSLEGLTWLDARPALAGLAVLDDGQTIPSRRWLDHICRSL